MCNAWYKPACLSDFGSGKVRFRDNRSGYTHFLDIYTINSETTYPRMAVYDNFNGTHETLDIERFYPEATKPSSVDTIGNFTSVYLEVNSTSKVFKVNETVYMHIVQRNKEIQLSKDKIQVYTDRIESNFTLISNALEVTDDNLTIKATFN